ncbi:low molecular weight phosphatase family protein [Propionibacteriaceae bacterium G1746]
MTTPDTSTAEQPVADTDSTPETDSTPRHARPPQVLFVCVKNGGKSQMAAALMRQLVGDRVTVTSAGTAAGSKLNDLSEQSLQELGATMQGQTPTQLTDEMLRAADRVIVLGDDAKVEPVEGMGAEVETWPIDEPSLRGIEGIERMRLVRDDINRRVLDLSMELTGQSSTNAAKYLNISDDLSQHFEGIFTRDEVRETVRRAHADLLANSKITSFLPIMVERHARAELNDRATAAGHAVTHLPELVFVSQRNIGRTPLAANLARHLGEGKVVVRAVGHATDEVLPLVRQVLQERGAPVQDIAEPLHESVLQSADVVITVGGDEQEDLPGKRRVHWDAPAIEGLSLEQVRAVADDVEARVRALLAEVLQAR